MPTFFSKKVGGFRRLRTAPEALPQTPLHRREFRRLRTSIQGSALKTRNLFEKRLIKNFKKGGVPITNTGTPPILFFNSAFIRPLSSLCTFLSLYERNIFLISHKDLQCREKRVGAHSARQVKLCRKLVARLGAVRAARKSVGVKIGFG